MKEKIWNCKKDCMAGALNILGICFIDTVIRKGRVDPLKELLTL